MKIVSLEAQNVKKLKAVRIPVDRPVTVIGGRNGQGKTTVLDCIEMALGGKKSIPSRPIRQGESGARIVLELDTLTVTRKFTAKDSYLEVTTKEGAKFPSAQAVLDELYNSLSFDPVAFARMKPADQADTLEQLCGLDTSELDAEAERVYSERTGVNRDVKNHAASLKGMTRHDDAPAEAVSVAALLDVVEASAAKFREAEAILDDHDQNEQAEIETKREIARLEEDLANAQAKLQINREVLARSSPKAEQARAAQGEAEAAIVTAKAQIEQAEQTNQKVRENEAHEAAQARLRAAEEQAEALTARLDAIREEKAKRLAEATYPIDGLAVSADREVLYQGIPFDQASGAEQIRVSAAIGLAMNPKLPLLLIRDGSLLDSDSMAVLAEMAEERGAQVFIERVGDGDPLAVVIEDGEVVAAETP